MVSFIRRFPAASYFTLAFALSWLGIVVVIQGGPIPAPPDDAKRLFTLVYLAMLVGPSVAGLTMTAITGGASGMREYGRRLFKWRLASRWYAIALLTAPLALVITALVLSVFSSRFAPVILGTSGLEALGPVQSNNVGSLAILAAMIGLGAGFFEELGWTGFAIPTLLKRQKALSTGLGVGVLWGAWHFLAIWWGSASAYGHVPVPLFLLVALFSFLPPYRVLMVRVYERTGSLLVCILMHASLTGSMIFMSPAVNGAAAVVYDLAFAATLWMFVAVSGTRTRAESVPQLRTHAPRAAA